MTIQFYGKLIHNLLVMAYAVIDGDRVKHLEVIVKDDHPDPSDELAQYSALGFAFKWVSASQPNTKVEVETDSLLLKTHIGGDWSAQGGSAGKAAKFCEKYATDLDITFTSVTKGCNPAMMKALESVAIEQGKEIEKARKGVIA